jgi:large subunit ribosomal protein L5
MSKVKTIKEQYNNSVETLQKELKLDNVMLVPRIEKIVVNTGTGRFDKNKEALAEIEKALRDITGQQPVKTQASQSIAGFKVREGQNVGMKVTLHGTRMWDFLNRLVSTALPRVRDFHGIEMRVIDGGGNLNIGIKEHAIFPEIVAEQVKNPFGFQVTVVSTATNKEAAQKLFKVLGFPLQEEE